MFLNMKKKVKIAVAPQGLSSRKATQIYKNSDKKRQMIKTPPY